MPLSWKQPKAKGIYQGLEFLDEAFDYKTLRDNLGTRQIVHIATHGKFEPGQPENSFILLGEGTRLTITEIQKLRNYMAKVHLVVLSACQTAMGGPDETGIEIPGISFYFLKNRVKSVIASLWLVDDASTSQLMQAFYRNLSSSTMSKAEALRQAQLAMIREEKAIVEARKRSLLGIEPEESAPIKAAPISHPYYWAPFILIGNGL